jgi:hypothetical protein
MRLRQTRRRLRLGPLIPLALTTIIASISLVVAVG